MALVLVALALAACGGPSSHTVVGPSMEPTIPKGTTVALAPLADGEAPARGDVLVLDPPSIDERVVGRVVAVAGDVLEIRSKQVIVDGEAVTHPGAVFRDDATYSPDILEEIARRDHLEPTTIPEGHVYVLGDNRDFAWDSRYFGAVPATAVVGRVVDGES